MRRTQLLGFLDIGEIIVNQKDPLILMPNLLNDTQYAAYTFAGTQRKSIVKPSLIFEKGIGSFSKLMTADLQVKNFDINEAAVYNYRVCVGKKDSLDSFREVCMEKRLK